MANNETRVLKTDTFEGWRQKGNEVSFELGDVDQLDSRILDKNYTYTASAGDALFAGSRFEEAPETVTDMLHVVIFTGSPATPSMGISDPKNSLLITPKLSVEFLTSGKISRGIFNNLRIFLSWKFSLDLKYY